VRRKKSELRGNSLDTITVCPRTQIWTYQSHPPGWDSVTLSFEKEMHRCVFGDTQTLKFEGTGRDETEIIRLYLWYY
jgi:hypothetical protein